MRIEILLLTINLIGVSSKVNVRDQQNGAKIEDGKLESVEDLRVLKPYNFYKRLMELSIYGDQRSRGEILELIRRKRQSKPVVTSGAQLFSRLDNTIASMISTVSIHELNNLNYIVASKTEMLMYIAEAILMFNKYVDEGTLIWIFMCVIFWFLVPVFIWIVFITLIWRCLRSHWVKVIVPLATSKHCEVSGNVLNDKNEIISVPFWEGCLEARFENTTQSDNDKGETLTFDETIDGDEKEPNSKEKKGKRNRESNKKKNKKGPSSPKKGKKKK